MKVIKYKFLSCEIEHRIIVQVQLLDEEGNPVMKEIKTPVMEEVEVSFTDDMGNVTTEIVLQPVYDENGEPVYEVTYEPVMTDEVKVEKEQVIFDKKLHCPTQEVFDTYYPIAEKEAVEGTIEVAGEFDPEPVVEPTADDVLDTMLGVE